MGKFSIEELNFLTIRLEKVAKEHGFQNLTELTAHAAFMVQVAADLRLYHDMLGEFSNQLAEGAKATSRPRLTIVK